MSDDPANSGEKAPPYSAYPATSAPYPIGAPPVGGGGGGGYPLAPYPPQPGGNVSFILSFFIYLLDVMNLITSL